MLTSKEVKDMVMSLGADLCGIAPADRFKEAPEGFKPTDVYKKCKSVIVYAKRLPGNIMNSSSLAPYTQVMNTLMLEVDILGIELSTRLEDMGVYSVLIPGNDPYDYWDSDKAYGRGILSHKHAAQLSGIGAMGRNTLLVNEKYGNMIYIGTLLVDTELEPDPAIVGNYCPPSCTLCIDSCPVKALNGVTCEQKLCRTSSIFKNEKGYILKSCCTCRQVCPNRLGIKNNK